MPPTRKKPVEDTPESQTTLNMENKHLEDEILKLNEKMGRIILMISHQQDKILTNIDEIIVLLKKQQEHLEHLKEPHIRNEALKTKEKNLQTWKTLIKKRKMAYYRAVKCSDTALTYRAFLTMEEQFIPNKFREKVTPQDTEEQKKIKKSPKHIKTTS